MLWLQIMVVVEEAMGAGAGVGTTGWVSLTEGAEEQGGGCRVVGKTGTLIILSLAKEAEKVAGAEAVVDDAMPQHVETHVALLGSICRQQQAVCSAGLQRCVSSRN